jgi:hypothetical protein
MCVCVSVYVLELGTPALCTIPETCYTSDGQFQFHTILLTVSFSFTQEIIMTMT